jgi:hypothetical protein
MTRTVRESTDQVLSPPGKVADLEGRLPPATTDTMTADRRAAINAAIAAGTARTVAHALFKFNAGELSLPE